MNIKMLKAAAAGLILSVSGLANAGLIGIDIDGTAGEYTLVSSSSWTLGYEFSLSADSSVTGLGFFDIDGVYGDTTVGLWTSSGTLLGTVNTNSNTVTEVSTNNGLWSWEFMDFNLLLSAGDYIVGSWGVSGMDYFYTDSDSIIENVLEFADDRYSSTGANFAFPNTVDGGATIGYLGANIMFDDSTSVPEPSTLAIFALGIMGLASRRSLLVNKKQ